MLNEKIFLLIWFWLVFVAVATFVSLLHWTSKLSILSIQVHNLAFSLPATIIAYYCAAVQIGRITDVALPVSSSSALDRPTGLTALAETLLVPAGGDVRLGAAAGALETTKVTTLSD